MMHATVGATSNVARLLPPPALAKPASRCGFRTSKRSGCMHVMSRPVGELGAHLLALRGHRARVDGDVLAPVQDALERLAEARRVRAAVGDLVALAGELQRRSRANIDRTIVTYSRSHVSGLSKGTPCQPSTTCGPDVPRPRMKRPPESASSVIAVIAVFAGERPGSCMIAVPSLIVFVCAPIHASGLTASEPQASARPHRRRSRGARPRGSGSMSSEICAPE